MFKWNPKLKGSGLINCIPQTGLCPNKCEDCFFQAGRSFLEPLEENLPCIPDPAECTKRVVRMNDGNDSNVNRNLVEKVSGQFEHYFFNTAIPHNLDRFSGPVVLTVNPGPKTDIEFFQVHPIPDNLMFIRIRANTWNVERVIVPAVQYYTVRGVAVILTFMAYYNFTLPPEHQDNYEWKKRTINSYWVLKKCKQDEILELFSDNFLVYSCGYKGSHPCFLCGNCLREYFATKERLLGLSSRMPYILTEKEKI